MSKSINVIIAIALLGSLLVASGLFYRVAEGRQVVITQFGKPVSGAITESGLHIKVPFIQKVHEFEKRVLEWDGYPNQIPTKDKRYIWVDTIARWRIADPLKFLESVGSETAAYARLDDIIDSVAREVITSHKLIEIVRESNRVIDILYETEGKLASSTSRVELLEKIQHGREALTRQMFEKASAFTGQYGIEIIDVRIKRINYVDDVRQKVYERMISERQQAAEQYRSEGHGENAEIEGKKVRELEIITSEAYRQAQEIKGKADATALQIYAESYGRDPEFYSFMRTLETYKDTIDRKSTIILSTDSEYYKHLKHSSLIE